MIQTKTIVEPTTPAKKNNRRSLKFTIHVPDSGNIKVTKEPPQKRPLEPTEEPVKKEAKLSIEQFKILKKASWKTLDQVYKLEKLSSEVQDKDIQVCLSKLKEVHTLIRRQHDKHYYASDSESD